MEFYDFLVRLNNPWDKHVAGGDLRRHEFHPGFPLRNPGFEPPEKLRYMWWWSFWSSVSDNVTLVNWSCTKRKCCHLIKFLSLVKSRVSVITLTMAGFPAYSILFHVTTNAHWASNWSLLTEARMSVLMASNTEASVLLAERFRALWYTPRSSFWTTKHTWWRHQMETFSSLLALCAGNSPVTGEFPA